MTYSPDFVTNKPAIAVPNVPTAEYRQHIIPQDCPAALARGEKISQAVQENRIADFERSLTYCENHGESNPDTMVHVSTFVIIDGTVYITYYANRHTAAEDPSKQEARIAWCPVNDTEKMTILTIQSVGDMLDGREITRLYDTICFYTGGDELLIEWTASPAGNYARLYCTFHIRTKTLSPIRLNRFKVGEIVNDYTTTGIQSALRENGIPYMSMWSDIGIMQKLTTRTENGETWYYTGTYSGNWNALIKSRDLITWEYVSTPSFPNNAQWENAVYVVGDTVYYFVRQKDNCTQGFLTRYDLTTDKWETPVLIEDAQSRSDFFRCGEDLFLIHAPIDRNGFGIVKINQSDIARSEPWAVVNLPKDGGGALFYPYSLPYGDTLYLSYTVARKHIRLTKFSLDLLK